MISHRYRCVFVHQRKCAGTSIIRAFGLDPQQPDWHFANDGTLSDEYAQTPQGYLRFSIVRNPWDRFVSGWKYCASTRERSLGDVLQNLPAEGHDYRHLTRPQHQILYRGDALAVDELIRFESLQAGFDRICERVGMPTVELPHLNRGNRADYRQYFDARSQRRFRAHFGEDIERFDYAF